MNLWYGTSGQTKGKNMDISPERRGKIWFLLCVGLGIFGMPVAILYLALWYNYSVLVAIPAGVGLGFAGGLFVWLAGLCLYVVTEDGRKAGRY